MQPGLKPVFFAHGRHPNMLQCWSPRGQYDCCVRVYLCRACVPSVTDSVADIE